MKKDIYQSSFKDYLKCNEIQIVDNFKYINNITEDSVYNQLSTIKQFHVISTKYANYNKNIFKSSIGKIVENNKVSLKKVKRFLKNIKYPKNDFEEFLLSISDEYISKAEICINEIYNSKYINLIKRSMNRNELCLGNTYFNNLRNYKGAIQITNLNKCSYNMVEIDCYYLLNKLRKKGFKFPWEKLADEFCNIENLSKYSSNFIIALMSYPYEFMKYCNRYRLNKKNWTSKKYMIKLKKSLDLEKNL
ncbi:spore coat protein S [Clostridium acetireducens DSM 10703]|uniref:Spore coat protein S n=1 Tax=Clostridium acetireducens DSM 10703 TaxID=1121290 RepID=A0A1E8EYS8_9CLOT|nr:hypothetical protein [Clostridium acetireducens]OFI06170.1 spore coat protein S [Clostridium acetireducens DSM 10703]